MINIITKELKESPKTLFLDRDGVINEKIEDGYVTNFNEFVFKKKSLKGLQILNGIFDYIVIVTNQRGIGRQLMSEKNLEDIHKEMMKIFEQNKININLILHCPDINNESKFRKPNTGMADLAKEILTNIDFKKSVMIGDSISDICFGKKKGMKCYMISNSKPQSSVKNFESLFEVSKYLNKKSKVNS